MPSRSQMPRQSRLPKFPFPMRNMMQFAARLRKEPPMTLPPQSMPWAIPCISRMTPIRSPSYGMTPCSFCPPAWYIPSIGQSAKNSSSSCFGQTAAMLTIPSFFPLTRTRQIKTCGMYWPMDSWLKRINSSFPRYCNLAGATVRSPTG